MADLTAVRALYPNAELRFRLSSQSTIPEGTKIELDGDFAGSADADELGSTHNVAVVAELYESSARNAALLASATSEEFQVAIFEENEWYPTIEAFSGTADRIKVYDGSYVQIGNLVIARFVFDYSIPSGQNGGANFTLSAPKPIAAFPPREGSSFEDYTPERLTSAFANVGGGENAQVGVQVDHDDDTLLFVTGSRGAGNYLYNQVTVFYRTGEVPAPDGRTAPQSGSGPAL